MCSAVLGFMILCSMILFMGGGGWLRIGAGLLLGAISVLYVVEIIQTWRRIYANHRVWPWLKAKFGWGLGVAELARRLEIDADELRRFEPSYRETHIAKRSGGMRKLHVPDRKTKALQRTILRRLLGRLRAHPAACGFERNRSIFDNALPHVDRAVVVRIDVVDFFPSTRAARLDAYFRRIGWNAEAAALLVKLTTHEGGLPQGAPTSPRLSNLVNFYLDAQLTRFVAGRKGTYTRYADDITISFPKDYPRRVRGSVQYVARLLRAKGYEIHRRKKLTIRRRHQRQSVTGLVVNAKVSLPRSRRRWLRAVEHRMATGRPATLTPEQLAGWKAFRGMIDRGREREP